MRDIVFIAYDEPNANSNFERLRTFVDGPKRIDGVKGILKAHKAAAVLSRTDWFYVVDGDAYILEGFNFNTTKNPENYRDILVWRSENNVNGLVYGFGGVKLINKRLLLEAEGFRVDMTASILGNFNKLDEVASRTKFNSSPFHAWRGAFRECVKLSKPIEVLFREKNRKERLHTWLTVGGEKAFGSWTLKGASDGVAYWEQHKNDPKQIHRINDFDWLKTFFEEQYEGLLENSN